MDNMKTLVKPNCYNSHEGTKVIMRLNLNVEIMCLMQL